MLALERQNESIVKQLAALIVEPQKKNQDGSNGESSNDVQNRDVVVYPQQQQHNMGEVHAKIVRLDFQLFHGEDPVGGVYKVHQFFSFHNTLLQNKLRLVSFHMKGKTLIWFQNLKKSGQILN